MPRLAEPPARRDRRPAGGAAGPPSISRLQRSLLLAAGVASTGLGLVGALLPLVPTTPFLLLAAACFARSSPRLFRWIYGNRLFGAYLRGYREGRGLPLRTVLIVLAMLWAGLAASAFVCIPARLWWLRALLAAVGVAVTVHMLRRAHARRR